MWIPPWTWKRFGLSGYMEWRHGVGQVSSNGHDLSGSRGRECHLWTFHDASNRKGPPGTQGSCSSMCGLWTSSNSITWKPARNAKSWAPSETCWIRICILTRCPDDLCAQQTLWNPVLVHTSHFRDEGPEFTPSPSLHDVCMHAWHGENSAFSC